MLSSGNMTRWRFQRYEKETFPAVNMKGTLSEIIDTVDFTGQHSEFVVSTISESIRSSVIVINLYLHTVLYGDLDLAN